MKRQKITTPELKAACARYLKIVEWSDDDKCFVGRCPGLFLGGCHGAEESEVYRELCGIVEEHVASLLADGERLPKATAGKTYSGKFVVRIDPGLHQKAALKAAAQNMSLNQFVTGILSKV
jgi:predicted HicB family RNase H-like nuclease